MALVEVHKIGNTIISFYDDKCRDKTPEEVAQAIKRIANIISSRQSVEHC